MAIKFGGNVNDRCGNLTKKQNSKTEPDMAPCDFFLFDRVKKPLLKDDFTAVSSALRQYLPEKDTPYILDVDLDFFSTKNPFKDLHERVNLYDKLAPLFTYKRTESNDPELILF
ncbi:UPF0489 protein C5orf22 like protein [Trachymyrmex zeteki]|uniref:UPF0489 protein C5orf22 like protein n=1 Tax=Mycetomoellerius zeteki TaxID=64791 RepID=A0A151XDT0_9HYME|nr:UPF0489 protein C5orf22 like protein [Trachymyrmex zeteki]